jgi:tetratricopeptide (TPR) repeat protein
MPCSPAPRRVLLLIAAAGCVCAGTFAAQAQGAVDATGAGAPLAAPLGKAEEAALELQRGNTAGAVAAFTEALKDSGLANDRRATLLNDRAVAHAKAGDAKPALEDFNKAVQLMPEYPPTYNNRGNLLVQLGQHEEAVKDFDRAALLAPKYAAAYSNRANARMKLGQTREAIADFTRAIELAPRSAPPLSGRGLALLSAGKPHAAIRDFSRAVAVNARFATAYRNRAEARLAMGQADEAIEDLSRASAFDPANAEIYIVRGYAYLNNGNALAAIKDLVRATEIAPQSAEAHQALGLANAVAEAYDDAFSHLNRAIELAPRSAVAFAYRAYVYKLIQQVDVAQKDLDTAVKLDANGAEVLWASGELDEARGRTDAAITALRKARDLKPGWKFAGNALARLGVSPAMRPDRPVAGAGVADWKVVLNGTQYFAVSDAYPTLRVPLEMMGEGEPALLEWELKPAPYKGYGILRFAAGRLLTPDGAQETEQAAILDLDASKVVGIQPHRLGTKVAAWAWEGDRVQIASVDGVTDEFTLRTVAQPEMAGVAAGAAAGAAGMAARRSPSSKKAAWSPWNDDVGARPPGQPKRQAQKRGPKPKSFFDMLFN